MSEENNTIRVLQYNILADGLSLDGFICSNFLDTVDNKIRTIPEFLIEIQEVRSDVRKLEEISKLYDTPTNTKNYERCLNWSNRWNKILKLIRDQDPDILVFQEMDRYSEALVDLDKMGYTSTFDSNKMPYSALWRDSEADSSSYLDRLNGQGYAFIPKLDSKARKISLKRGIIDPDNDGCSIFWKKRFTLERLEFCQFHNYQSDTKDSDGGMAVVLYDSVNQYELCVITAHLPSGQTRERELERIELLSEMDNGIFRRFILRMMKEIDRVIIALDMNSDPLETYGKVQPNEITNIWNSFHTIPHLLSIWDPYLIESKPVTVNKIRGSKSDQVQKIGIHSLELIDHVFYSDSIIFKNFSRSIMTFDTIDNALNNLIPNELEPSDHYPVIIDFEV